MKRSSAQTSRRKKVDIKRKIPVTSRKELKSVFSRLSKAGFVIDFSEKNRGSFDSCDGLEDIRAKRLQLTDPMKIKNDPSILLRAVRFEKELQLILGSSLIEALGVFMYPKALTHQQRIYLRNEFIIILKSEEAGAILRAAFKRHLLRFISSGFDVDATLEKDFCAIDKACQWFYRESPGERRIDVWVMRAAVFFALLGFKKAQNACDQMLFSRGDRLRILKFNNAQKKIEDFLSLPGQFKPSVVYKFLNDWPYEVILLVKALTKQRRCAKHIEAYLLEFNHVRLEIQKSDFADKYKKSKSAQEKAFEDALLAKIDGKLGSLQKERDFIIKCLHKSAKTQKKDRHKDAERI